MILLAIKKGLCYNGRKLLRRAKDEERLCAPYVGVLYQQYYDVGGGVFVPALVFDLSRGV